MTAALSLTMAYEHVRAGAGRLALTVLAVALGVALVVACRLMNAAVLTSFLDTVDGIAGRAALTVSAGEGVTFAEEVVERVTAVPGVRLAVPLVRSVAFPDDGSGELLTVHGVDLTHEAEVRVYQAADDPTQVIEDLVVFLSRPDSVVLTRDFAARRGLGVGSAIVLVTPTGVKPFTVRGLLDPQGLARTLGGRLVVMDILAAEQAFTQPGQVTQIDVLANDGVSVVALKEAIAAALPPGLTVTEPSLRRDVIRRAVSGFQAMITAFGLLAAVAGFVVCYGRLGAVFEARSWQMGMLRAIGLRRSVVFVELLKESLLLGVAGTAIGIPIGVAVGRWGLPLLVRTTALNFRLPLVAARPVLDAEPLLFGGIVGLLAAVLAAAVPALRLASRPPVDALAMRGREVPATATGTALGLGLVGLGVALALWERSSRVTALGLVTTALIAIASCVLAGPVVQHGRHVVLVAWRLLFGATGELAADGLSQGVRRSSLTVATLGVGLGAVLMLGMLAWSFERTLVSRLAIRMRADLSVTSSFASDGYRPAQMSDAVLEGLRDIPGVALAVAEEERDVADGSSTVAVDAWDGSGLLDRRVSDWSLGPDSLPDALARVATGDGVLVSGSFAYQHRTRPGDFVTLPSPSGPVKFLVTGVTDGQPENAVVLHRDLYKRLWNDPLVMWIHVALDPTARRADVEAAIAQRLGERFRITVRSRAAIIEYFADQARQAFRFTYLLEAITFLLVLFAVGDTLAAAVAERTRHFGMMRAMGLHRAALLRMVLLEGAAIGVLGVLVALTTGFALGAFWVNVQFPAVLGWRLDLHVPWAFILVTTGLVLGLCVAGSLLPSLHAARLSVSHALRDE